MEEEIKSLIENVEYIKFHITNTTVCCITLHNGYIVAGEGKEETEAYSHAVQNTSEILYEHLKESML